MIELSREFFAVTEYSEFATFSADTLAQFYPVVIEDNQHVMLAVEIDGRVIGFGLALVFPLWFNADVKMAQELLWWVEPAYRKKHIGIAVLDALEAAVCEKGVVPFIVACLESLEPERLTGLYTGRGYKPFERTFIKGLKDEKCHPVSQQS